jgi:hypothetical protein
VAPDPRLNEEGCLMKRGRLMKNKQGMHEIAWAVRVHVVFDDPPDTEIARRQVWTARRPVCRPTAAEPA